MPVLAILNVFGALAMQSVPLETTPVPPPPPPIDKLVCILATVAVGEQPGAPLTMFQYFESGIVRIERELAANQSTRNVDDLVLQLDKIWYAQGRAAVVQGPVTSGDSATGTAPTLQINIDPAFAQSLPNAMTLSFWDENGRREHYDLKNFDRTTLDSWRSCVTAAASPTLQSPSASSRYRVQDALQLAKPINPHSWITSDDYPSRSLRQEVTGTVTYTLNVGVNGRVKGCVTDNGKPTNADGTPNLMADLNDTTCRLIKRRARFLPATDNSGRPFAVDYTGRVRWVLPE